MIDDNDDICRNKHGGNPESEKAFEATEGRIPNDEERILERLAIVGRDGHTGQELGDVLGMLAQTVSARCTGLKAKGLIMKKPTPDGLPGPDGKTYIRRPTRSGVGAAVLVLTSLYPVKPLKDGDEDQPSLFPELTK